MTKFDEDLKTYIEHPKCRCKMWKRAKNKVQLLYKNGGKKVGAGEIT